MTLLKHKTRGYYVQLKHIDKRNPNYDIVVKQKGKYLEGYSGCFRVLFVCENYDYSKEFERC